jgi:hypothetical protein
MDGTTKTAEQTKVARQTLKIEQEKKHSIRYVPAGKADVRVDGKSTAVDEIASVVYIDKAVLALLGNPKEVTLTVEAVG